MHESTDPRFRQAYLAREVHCFGCEVAERTQNGARKDNDGQLPPGSRWQSMLRDDWQDPRLPPD